MMDGRRRTSIRSSIKSSRGVAGGKKRFSAEVLAKFDELSSESELDVSQDESDAESQQTVEKSQHPSGLSNEQVQRFRDAYNIFDKDGDGGVSVHELAHVMRCLGQDASDEDVRRMFNEVDQDGSGEIDFDEFLEIMKNHVVGDGTKKLKNSSDFTEEDWAEAFTVFDLDGDGFITAEELGTVLANMGESLQTFELEEMVQEADSDNDGKLSLEDFVKVMAYGIEV